MPFIPAFAFAIEYVLAIVTSLPPSAPPIKLPLTSVENTTLPAVAEFVKLLRVYTPEPAFMLPVMFVPDAAEKVTLALLVMSVLP